MSRFIEKTVVVDSPVDVVWHALTDAEELTRWFPVDARVKPGPDEPTNIQFSHVSGGGGERDSRHSHDPQLKGDFEQNSEQRRRPNSDRGNAGPMPTPETRDRTEH